MEATMTHNIIPTAINVQQINLLSSSPVVSVVTSSLSSSTLSEKEERSLCDGLNGIYSVWFHIAAVIIILLASLIGTALPIMAKYVPSLRANPYYFSLGKTAATGVLLSVATIHLINEASKAFEEYCVPSFFKNYNAYSFLFALMAALMMQAIDLQLAVVAERWLKAKHQNEQRHDKELVLETTPSPSLQSGNHFNTAIASTRASDVVIESAEQQVNDNIVADDATYCKNMNTSINDNTRRENGNNNNEHSYADNEHNYANNEHNNVYRPQLDTNAADSGVDTYKKQNFAIRDEMQNCTLPIRDSNMSAPNKKCDSGDVNNINYKTTITLHDALHENEHRSNKIANIAEMTTHNKYNGHNIEHTSVIPQEEEEECSNTNVEKVRYNNSTKNAKHAQDEVPECTASKVKPTAIIEEQLREEQKEESTDKRLRNCCSELSLMCNTEQKDEKHQEKKEENIVMSDRLSHLNATESDCHHKSEECRNHLQVPSIVQHVRYNNTMNNNNNSDNNISCNNQNNNKSHIVNVESTDRCSTANNIADKSIYAAHGHSHQIIIPPEEMNSIRRVIAAVCMEFGVTLHSVFVGLAVGFTTNDELKPLLVALIFHQMFEGMAMGSRLVDAEFHKVLEITLAIVFATSAPLGIIIGIIAATISPSTMAGGGFVTMLAILDAFCGGILLYLAFNLLLFDFANDLRMFSADDVPNRRWKKTGLYVALWFGMLLMALVGKWLETMHSK